MLELLRRLVAEHGAALLLITHDLAGDREHVRAGARHAGRARSSSRGRRPRSSPPRAHPHTRALIAGTRALERPADRRRAGSAGRARPSSSRRGAWCASTRLPRTSLRRPPPSVHALQGVDLVRRARRPLRDRRRVGVGQVDARAPAARPRSAAGGRGPVRGHAGDRPQGARPALPAATGADRLPGPDVVARSAHARARDRARAAAGPGDPGRPRRARARAARVRSACPPTPPNRYPHQFSGGQRQRDRDRARAGARAVAR